VIALFATSNTVLIALISGSRIFYGISKAGALPARLSATGRTGVPTLSVELTAVAAATVAFFIDIGTSAKLTNLGLFIAYVAVNLALIALKDHGSKAAFTSPRLMGFPIFALLGAVSSLAFLAYLSLELWPYILLLLSSGAAIFFLMHKK
jgi:APA family basic amino acid/polyamine antiporter